ncbi:oocyte zinc finger protein XlCOF20-like [Cyprinodon tularosa]|uniref:oocyte zinc finger protein XlCOF20-like n=1 Tax=Cyprinodon variegatus TaxID=28743 RepID=UPI00074287DF|nr:PREDICTED: oocyte zinc finger protein XlCOF20-like [Cyprinodon variegatus]XP_038144276.1 oocyte zinc finger protein XlCOF20-like [Cyprinodon tularosa]
MSQAPMDISNVDEQLCEGQQHVENRDLDQLNISEKSGHRCDHCGKGFKSSYCLKRHLPFLCYECGKRFRQSGHLDQHLYIHTGEKPFVCHQCGKSFARRSSLRTHLHINTRVPTSAGGVEKASDH